MPNTCFPVEQRSALVSGSPHLTICWFSAKRGFREECQAALAQKDAAAADLLATSTAQRDEIERLQNENGILKQGVRIQVVIKVFEWDLGVSLLLLTFFFSRRACSQQAALERGAADAHAAAAAAGPDRAALLEAGRQAVEHIRRLEHANYALRVQLEQMSPAGHDMTSGLPRWGEGY